MKPAHESPKNLATLRNAALAILLAGMAAVFLLPQTAEGREHKNYITAKGGFYFPPDGDNVDVETGSSWEVALGHHFGPLFAIEGGVGYIESDVSFYSESFENTFVPVTVTFKGMQTGGAVDFYVGLGMGAYFEYLKGRTNTFSGDDVVFGFHYMLGLAFDITENTFFGVEWKWLLLGDAEFTDPGSGTRITLSGQGGNLVTGTLGYRF